MITAAALRRPETQRSLSARAWALVSALLTKIAEIDVRNKNVEPFGL